MEIDPGVLVAGGFNGVTAADGWTFQTRAVPPDRGATRFVVAADGSGDFATVQGAVDFVPDHPPRRVTIFIRDGTYKEIVYFRHKHDVTFLGEDRNRVVIEYANNEIFNGPPPGVRTNEQPGTFPYRRAAFMADRSSGIHLVNLTVVNVTPPGGGQAEALLLSGGRNIVSHVTLRSHQDTVQLNDPVYLEKSRIDGDTDFLWGRGPAYFHDCDLTEQSGGPFMWVRSTAAAHGFVFVSCRFRTTGAPASRPFLARNTAAYPHSEVALIECALGDIESRGVVAGRRHLGDAVPGVPQHAAERRRAGRRQPAPSCLPSIDDGGRSRHGRDLPECGRRPGGLETRHGAHRAGRPRRCDRSGGARRNVSRRGGGRPGAGLPVEAQRACAR